MPLWEHVEELRKRLLVIITFFAIFFFVIFFFSRDLLGYMEATFVPGEALIVRRPTEYLWLMMKLSAYLSLIIILPLIVYETFAFASPGLYDHEIIAVRKVIAISAGFVALGFAVSFLVLKRLLPYFATLSKNADIETLWSIDLFFDFVIKFTFSLSIFSLLPVVFYFMIKANIIDSEDMKKWRKYIYPGGFAFCALLLPQPFTLQLVFFLIFIAIYELFIHYGTNRHQDKKTPGDLRA